MGGPLIKVPVKRIEEVIYLIRGEKVMLDRDLAGLYEIPTKALKQAVRRNSDRFPDDFMFVLDKTEFEAWRSQFVTSNADRKGLRHPPMAFTEQGVAMLSSVLNSKRAVQVNIAIMRLFGFDRCLRRTQIWQNNWRDLSGNTITNSRLFSMPFGNS